MYTQVQTPQLPQLPVSGRTDNYEPPVPAVLSVILLILGIFTAITAALIMWRTYSPVIYWDQWTIVDNLMQSGGHPTLHQLWAQHNEHRIPVGRLACYADLFLFGGRNVSLIIGIYLVQLFHLLVFVWMIRRAGYFAPALTWTGVGLLFFCMFSPIQIENFSWGFEITFVMAGLAASLAFACAVWFAEASKEGVAHRFAVVPLLLAIAAGLVSEGSLSNGIFVWPVLSMLGFALRFPRRAQFILGAAGALAVAAYMTGYVSPAHHSNPFTSIRHPLDTCKYVVTYLASTWDPSLPNTGTVPSVSEMLTALAIAATLLGAFRVFLKRNSASYFETFLYADIGFVLTSATVTALGRQGFGMAQATASRYQTIALVFWACFGLLFLSWCARAASRWPWLVQFQTGVLILMIASTSRFSSYEKFAMDRQASLAKGFAALANNPSDQESLKLLFPVPQLLTPWYQYLRAHNLGPDPRGYGASAQVALPVPQLQPSVMPASNVPRILGYALLPAARCSGFLDESKAILGQSGTFAVGGWAWDLEARKPPIKVVLATSVGIVAGTAELGGSRPDVQVALPQVTTPNSGWNGSVRASSGEVLRAFAVLADTKSACPLQNELRMP